MERGNGGGIKVGEGGGRERVNTFNDDTQASMDSALNEEYVRDSLTFNRQEWDKLTLEQRGKLLRHARCDLLVKGVHMFNTHTLKGGGDDRGRAQCAGRLRGSVGWSRARAPWTW